MQVEYHLVMLKASYGLPHDLTNHLGSENAGVWIYLNLQAFQMFVFSPGGEVRVFQNWRYGEGWIDIASTWKVCWITLIVTSIVGWDFKAHRYLEGSHRRVGNGSGVESCSTCTQSFWTGCVHHVIRFKSLVILYVSPIISLSIDNAPIGHWGNLIAHKDDR